MAFVDEMRDYINLSHGFAWRNSTLAGVPDEPALVAAFLDRKMFRGIRRILKSYLPPSAKLLVSGIFTHQTPTVQLKKGGNSVEIGDLLLIHQHFDLDPKKPISGRALLLQAKKGAKTNTGPLTANNDPIQFDLYQNWPVFSGVRRLNRGPDGMGGDWNFQNPSFNGDPWNSSAQYLIVFDGNAYTAPQAAPAWNTRAQSGPDYLALQQAVFAGNCAWINGPCKLHPALASSGVDCFSDFAQTFNDFLNGGTGRAFQPGITTGADHWSIFVNHMLSIASKANGNYKYTLNRQNVTRGMRGRRLHFSAAEPILFLAATEELNHYLESSMSEGLPFHEHSFEFTNGLLGYIGSLRNTELMKKFDVPPDYQESNDDDGHVPMLVVSTIGEETLHLE